jgi:hypothetical protein
MLEKKTFTKDLQNGVKGCVEKNFRTHEANGSGGRIQRNKSVLVGSFSGRWKPSLDYDVHYACIIFSFLLLFLKTMFLMF